MFYVSKQIVIFYITRLWWL